MSAIRRSLDKNLRVRGDEERLTVSTSEAVYKGFYWWPSKLESVTSRQATRTGGGFVVDIVRRRLGGGAGSSAWTLDTAKRFPYQAAAQDVVIEMKRGGVRNRFDRVERYARRIKTGVLAGALAIGAVLTLAAQTSESYASETPPCEDVVPTDVPTLLLPADMPEAEGLTERADAVCMMGDEEFLVFEPDLGIPNTPILVPPAEGAAQA